MLFRGLGIALTCVACGFQHGAASSDANGQPLIDGDVVIDAPTEPLDAPVGFCYGTFKSICFPSMPSGDYAISATTLFDTDADASCSLIVAQSGGPAICVVAAANISLQANVAAKGSRALAFVATGTFSNGGTLDVGSYVVNPSPFKGAGVASGAACGSPTGGAVDDNGGNSGAGGGAGGSFGGAGGNGAKGRSGAGGDGGTASPTISSSTGLLRGGCDGTSGGAGNNNAGGAGGFGGGAIYIVAETSITNGGTIRSSGQGGLGGGKLSGGGGGGAGGMIVLDSPAISNTGFVIANGGGGGEGGGQNDPGLNGTSGLTTARAAGGTGNINGGDGGAGGGAATNGGDPGLTDVNGAGGGGGAAGVIRVLRGTLTGAVSPAAT
jgi:hypothetical protein